MHKGMSWMYGPFYCTNTSCTSAWLLHAAQSLHVSWQTVVQRTAALACSIRSIPVRSATNIQQMMAPAKANGQVTQNFRRLSM